MLSGIVTLVTMLQFAKAFTAISVTGKPLYCEGIMIPPSVASPIPVTLYAVFSSFSVYAKPAVPFLMK